MIDSHQLVLIREKASIGSWASMQKVLKLDYGGVDLSKRSIDGFEHLKGCYEDMIK
jgi:hypothetical protein